MTGSIRQQLDEAMRQAARAIGVDGDLPDLELARAKSPERGEYASSAGMKLALKPGVLHFQYRDALLLGRELCLAPAPA